MSGGGPVRAITDLFGWGQKRPESPESESVRPPEPAESVFPSRAFPRFLSAVASREAPVLVDLGPVVGSNVTFFGERLGCKLFVEDFFADLQRKADSKSEGPVSDVMISRLPQESGTIDGILCWDLFDYLDRPSAQALARHLSKLLRPGGVLFGFFGTANVPVFHFTRFIIVDDATLRRRWYPAPASTRQVLLNRDIIKMFDGLRVSDSYLLKINTREMLFRKP